MCWLGDEDALPPRALHPIFFGSFDWHSCVHGWWTLLTLRRLFPDIPEAAAIAELANSSFTAAKVAGELAYLDRPLEPRLRAALRLGVAAVPAPGSGAARPRPGRTQLEPLARAFAERLRDYLPMLTYPIRVGTHFNTAFALILVARLGRGSSTPRSPTLIRERSRDWFGDDRDCQAWEPGGDEFLSPALIEALCMARTHPHAVSATGSSSSCRGSRSASRRPCSRRRSSATAATARSRTSTASTSAAPGAGARSRRCRPPRRAVAAQAAATHLAAALPHISGDYMGEHWLASFALLALMSEG